MRRHQPVNRTQMLLEPRSLTTILPIVLLRQEDGLVFSPMAVLRHRRDGANSKVETQRKLHDVLSQVHFSCACLLLKLKWFLDSHSCIMWPLVGLGSVTDVPEDYRFTIHLSSAFSIWQQLQRYLHYHLLSIIPTSSDKILWCLHILQTGKLANLPFRGTKWSVI